MYTHEYNVVHKGADLKDAKCAFIFLHGRGATADSILSLRDFFKKEDAAYFAPQATNSTWYPYSFMEEVQDNQPALDSALKLVNTLINNIILTLDSKNIYFIGFSQGACLTLEYVARHAKAYGGVVAFTGGLIGKDLELSNYTGSLEKTPVLLSTGTPDPHVPLTRVEDSKDVLEKQGALVELSVFQGKPHTITSEELALAKKKIL